MPRAISVHTIGGSPRADAMIWYVHEGHGHEERSCKYWFTNNVGHYIAISSRYLVKKK